MATVTSSKRHLLVTSDTYTSNGDVTVGGDLFVNGSQTSINTATLDVEDKNITLNYGGNEASSQGAGITIAGSNATLIWDEANTRWKFSDSLVITDHAKMASGNVSGKFAVKSTDVHASYDFYNNGTSYFNDAVTIDANLTLSGGVDVLMSDNSGAAVEFKQGTDLYMRFITTNGGEHIEVNKNMEIQGLTATAGTFSSTLTAGGKLTINKESQHVTQNNISANNAHLDLYNTWESDTDQKGSIITFTDNYYGSSSYNKTLRAAIKGGTDNTGNTADGYLEFYTDSGGANTPNLVLRLDKSKTAEFKGNIVMAANATVDGVDISALPTSFAPVNAEANVKADWNATSGDAEILNKPTIPSSSNFITTSGGQTITSGGNIGLTIKHDDFNEGLVIHRNHADHSPSITFKNNGQQIGILFGQESDNNPYWRQGEGTTNYKIWHAGNDGASSGLNADLLDDKHAADFAPASHSHNIVTHNSTNYIDVVDHGNNTWFRNSSNVWTFQGGTAGDNWTETFALHLPATDSNFNNKLAELGQRTNNGSDGGKYKGVRIVKSTGSGTVADGDLKVANISATSSLSVTGTITSQSTTVVGTTTIQSAIADPGDLLHLNNQSNGAKATIRFTDQASSPTQYGRLSFGHSDSASYGSAAHFVLGSTESTTTILANGKLMYAEGIYSKPSSGTGAGTRKDSNWDTAYGWGNHASAGYSTAAGVEDNADVTDTANVVAALTAGTNIQINANGTISATDTNTTYSVGDGGLTQKNFTTTLKNKLDGIESGADVTDAINVSAAGAMLKSGEEKSTAMKEFETTLTNEDDWQNSPISVRERGNVGSAQSADKYSPNLCFHWGGRSSNSLWMAYNGILNWGSYSSSGIPAANGTFKTGTLYAGAQSITSTKVANWNTAYGWGNHASAGYLTSSSTQSKYLRSDVADTAAELITFSKGISTDGNAKFYNWRALENTSNTSNQYYRIAKITGSQSTRFIIELAGRSTSYSDGALPAYGKLVGQLNNDNNYDLTYYNHTTNDVQVVTEIGQVDVSTTQTNIYIRVGQFAEVTAIAHITDGSITTYQSNSASTSAPIGYSQANVREVWNSSNDGSGSGLDADFLDGYHASSFLRSDGNDTASGTLTFTGEARFALDAGYGNSEIRLPATSDQNPRMVFYRPTGSGVTSYPWRFQAGGGGSSSSFYIGTGSAANNGSESISNKFSLSSSGVLTVSGDVIAYGSPSDAKYKENVKPIENALDKVMDLEGVSFDWKENNEILDIKEDIGFIAQDVQKVIPELVRENEEGNLSLRYQGLIPVLLEAMKEQQKQIDDLKAQMSACNKRSCKCNCKN